MTVLGDVEVPLVGQVEDANWAGPLLQAVIRADESNRELFSGSGYGQAVHELCDRVRALGGPRLWGVSDVGNRIIGAMLLADPDLRVWTAGDPVAVALIDGFVAGPAGVALSASRVQSLGASQVTGMVLGLHDTDLPAAGEPHDETQIQVVRAERSAAIVRA